jgi:hypothetical protein
MTEQLSIPPQNIELLKSKVYPNLSGINIAQGCGVRPCRICSENSPGYQSSMPIRPLEQIFSTYNGDNQLMLFGRGDSIYYRDEQHRIADVFTLALRSNTRVVARTHGCLRNETDTVDAVRDLVTFLVKNKPDSKQARLDLSVDEYGWQGVNPEEHVASVAAFYQLISPLNPNVFVFSNPNAKEDELGSVHRLYELLQAAKIPIRRTYPQEIFYFIEGDRPSKLNPQPPKVGQFKPWTGTFIETDGTILFDHPTLNIIRRGNIYTEIR